MKKLPFTYLAVVGAGILLSWAFPRFHFHALAWVALTPLFVCAAWATPRGAALLFFLCAHVFYSILLQWLMANIFWAGGWAIVGQQILCIILSLYWALLGYVWRWAYERSPRYGGALCLAGLWTGMELLQARLFTGFGWGALGYTQSGNLLTAQWAAVGSVALISFFLVLCNALLALAALTREQRWTRLCCALILVGALHGGGYLLLAQADYESSPMRAGVIQPNFSQEMKWDPAYALDMAHRTSQLSRALAVADPVDLIVWPEALLVQHYGIREFAELLANTALDTHAHLFTGAVREEYATAKSYNSSVLISPDGVELGYYDKVRLVAFGEYIPFEEYLPFIGSIAFGGVSAGREQKIFPVAERRLGPLICFEVMFAPMAERLRATGADMLVVVTNLAWFGGSNAIPQELEIARMRAIETRLPLIHSANTGISGVFDPYGRFSVVRHTVAPQGGLVDWGDRARPPHAIMRRLVGAFPVAAPGTRIVPFGPVLLPWIAAALGVLFFVIAAISRFLPELAEEEPETAPKPKPRAKAKTKTKEKTGETKRAPRKKKRATDPEPKETEEE